MNQVNEIAYFTEDFFKNAFYRETRQQSESDKICAGSVLFLDKSDNTITTTRDFEE